MNLLMSFIGGFIGGVIVAVVVVGVIRLKWWMEDKWLDRTIERAYPELKGKLK